MTARTLPTLTSLVGDLFTDRRALGTLIAASAVLLAVGVDPRIFAPQLSTVQAAVRARPDLESVVLVSGLLSAICVLVGGAVGDLSRARPLIRGGLLVMLVAALAGFLPPESPLFVVGRIAATVAGAFAFPVALASVALAYTGIARATAIGIAYGAYGGGQALMPILLTVVPGTFLPGFVAELVALAIAFRLAWPRSFELPRPTRAERPHVLGTALWASAIVALATGLLWIGGGWDNPVRIAIVGLGIGLAAAFLVEERWRRRQSPESVRVERRPVTVALFAGVVIAVAQNAPMAQLPFYFGIILGFGPLFGVVALAPLFAALVLAGPIAGWLLARLPPRTLVGAGVVAVGVGNLLLAALIGPRAGYLGFILPLAAVGAGFVIATTVRTAIIFASVPRGLPATAAALNESSIAVGNRVGILASTAVVATVSMAALRESLTGMSPDAAAAQIAQFEQILAVIGTPAFSSVVHAVPPGEAAAFAVAYVTGLRTALVLGGVAAILGGAVAWLLLGRQDPLHTMWEHRDERGVDPSTPGTGRTPAV